VAVKPRDRIPSTPFFARTMYSSLATFALASVINRPVLEKRSVDAIKKGISPPTNSVLLGASDACVCPAALEKRALTDEDEDEVKSLPGDAEVGLCLAPLAAVADEEGISLQLTLQVTIPPNSVGSLKGKSLRPGGLP
jgi:hypothetical protein